SALRPVTRLPLWVKLTPNVTDITVVARAAQDAGADALSVANTMTGMAIDVHTRRPKLGAVTGGLSGPAIRPVAVYLTWQVARACTIPVIGMGGIATADDALEFLIAGAGAIAVGTAVIDNPGAPTQIRQGLAAYLARHGFSSLNDIVGTLAGSEASHA
ncbi:MAG: dihydroorotate dehydrogenase, partial [Dehalococcoidia bacterium]|nr:dihydroorotate dehydrogenase [Dehalococcoidia bacterium]